MSKPETTDRKKQIANLWASLDGLCREHARAYERVDEIEEELASVKRELRELGEDV